MYWRALCRCARVSSVVALAWEPPGHGPWRRRLSHSAEDQCTVQVRYRHHFLFGQEMQVRRRVRWKGQHLLYAELANGDVVAVPTWMTDPVLCAGFTVGEPTSSLEALLDLRHLLDVLAVGAAGVAAASSSGPKEPTHEAARANDAVPAPTGPPGSSGTASVDGDSKRNAADSSIRGVGARRSPLRGRQS